MRSDVVIRVSPAMVGFLGVVTLVLMGSSPLPGSGGGELRAGGGGGSRRFAADATAAASGGGGGGLRRTAASGAAGAGAGAGAAGAGAGASVSDAGLGAPVPAATAANAAEGGAPDPAARLEHAAGRPFVDFVWKARETMKVAYGGRGRSVTVYRNDFPGSTLWLDFWSRVEEARWEEDTLDIMEWYLSPSHDEHSILIDFGSWIGPSVLWGALFASRVYSLEPDPVSFSTLVANINANEDTARKTRVFWRCIAKEDGEVEMAGSGESNTRMIGVLDTKFLKPDSHWMVPCLTLPNFIEEQGIDVRHVTLVKMDTEGTELWLLPSLRPWLEGLAPGRKPAFWLSVHSPFWIEPSADELKAAWDVLALFEFVYDQSLRRIFPANMKPSFCEDFCTFLLSDIEYGGKNVHAPKPKKRRKKSAAAEEAA